jgi:hypothetical protein
MSTLEPELPEPLGNIFARELEDILKARGLRLGKLDDLQDEYGGRLLHPEKVRRLQQSLLRPVYPSLSPHDINRVIKCIGLSVNEQLRLWAAVLATAVQRELSKTLDKHIAFAAAGDVFDMCLSSLREQSGRFEAIRAISLIAEEPVETALSAVATAVSIIKDTTDTLNNAQAATTRPTRILNAQVAVAAYSQALSLLDLAERQPDTQARCQFWRETAMKGRALAEELMGE